MKVLTDDIDRFPYQDYNGKTCFCRLRIWEEAGQPPVALATEHPSNPGRSITNAVEIVVKEVWRLLECPDVFTYIEHCPASRDQDDAGQMESFHAVVLTPAGSDFIYPRWQRLSQEEVDALFEKQPGLAPAILDQYQIRETRKLMNTGDHCPDKRNGMRDAVPPTGIR